MQVGHGVELSGAKNLPKLVCEHLIGRNFNSTELKFNWWVIINKIWFPIDFEANQFIGWVTRGKNLPKIACYLDKRAKVYFSSVEILQMGNYYRYKKFVLIDTLNRWGEKLK